MTIESFAIDDYNEVYALWENIDGIGLSDADNRENLEAYLERNPGMSFVAKHEGAIVGAVLAGHDGRRAYIHHLAVQEEYRRRGIGNELLRSCMEELKKAGLQKCHVFVFSGNESGGRFWQSRMWEKRAELVVYSRNIPQVDAPL